MVRLTAALFVEKAKAEGDSDGFGLTTLSSAATLRIAVVEQP